MIPFNSVIPRESRDSRLGDKLKAESAGILNFMLEGARMYFGHAIHEPEAVKSATQQYFGDKNSVVGFMKDATVKQLGGTVEVSSLYEAYVSYCEEEALMPVSKGQFGGVVKSMGYESTRSASERKWRGLRLRGQSQESDDAFLEHDMSELMKHLA